MCTELSLPLSRRRSAQDQMLLANKLENMQLGLEYNAEGLFDYFFLSNLLEPLCKCNKARLMRVIFMHE